MKIFIKFTALALVFAMLLSFVACFESGNDAEESDAESTVDGSEADDMTTLKEEETEEDAE